MKLPLNILNNKRLLSTVFNSVYFMIPSIFSMLIQLFTTPIFARNLSPTDFSIIGYFTAIGSIYSSLINFSLFSYYMRGFHARSEKENNHVISTTVLFLMLSNSVFLAVNYFGWSIYFKLAEVSFPIYPYLLITYINSFMGVFTGALFMYYKMYKKPYRFMWYSILSTMINIGLGLYLVVSLHMGATGKLLAIMFGNGLVGLISFKLLCREWMIDWQVVRNAFKLGYPMIIIVFLSIPVTNLDKLLLERNHDIVNYSYYTIGMQFSGYLMMMYTSIYQAFEPDVYRFANTSKRKLGFLAVFIFGFAAVCNLIFALLSKPVIGFLTSYRYTGAARYANIFVWSNYFLLMTMFLAAVFVAKGKTLSLLWRKVAVSMCGTGLLYYSVDRWGFMGAAGTRVAVNVFDCALMLFIGLVLLRRGRESAVNATLKSAVTNSGISSLPNSVGSQ